MRRIITLTTDFGEKDPWVGAVRGVILSINPDAELIDITHLVSPQNILEGSFVFSQAYPFFPEGTIHVVVVDPGVGSRRRPLLVETGRFCFIGPDNGVFTQVLKGGDLRRIIHLTNSEYFLEEVSATFHARDIFAPCAAHLSLGVDPASMGEPVEDPCTLDITEPERTERVIRGVILYVDTFGNLITNISEDDLSALLERGEVDIDIGWRTLRGLVASYSEGKPGEPVALIGSTRRLEIAAFKQRATDLLDAGVGDRVEVRLRVGQSGTGD